MTADIPDRESADDDPQITSAEIRLYVITEQQRDQQNEILKLVIEIAEYESPGTAPHA